MPFGSEVEPDRYGGTAGKGLDRGSEAALREDRWVNPSGDLLQVLHHVAEALGSAGQLFPELRQFGRHHGLRGTQVQPERHETLLGAVVQVAFDAAASLVTCGDNTGAGGGELGSALGICDRRRHEDREGTEARLGAPGQASVRG